MEAYKTRTIKYLGSKHFKVLIIWFWLHVWHECWVIFPLLPQLLKKISTEESPGDRSAAELDALKHTDWVGGGDGVHFVTQRTMRPCVCLFDKCSRVTVVSAAGSPVGAADEGAPAGSEAEEGAGAAVRPAAHRVQPHALRDADAGYSSSQLPAPQSHGESPERCSGSTETREAAQSQRLEKQVNCLLQLENAPPSVAPMHSLQQGCCTQQKKLPWGLLCGALFNPFSPNLHEILPDSVVLALLKLIFRTWKWTELTSSDVTGIRKFNHVKKTLVTLWEGESVVLELHLL